MMCPFSCNFHTEAYVWEKTFKQRGLHLASSCAVPFGGEEGASERKADGQLRDTVPTLARDGCVGRLIHGLGMFSEGEWKWMIKPYLGDGFTCFPR